MNDDSIHTASYETMEERLHLVLDDAKKSFIEGRLKFENQIQKSPTKTVLGAVAVGYLLHHLPVRAMIVTQVRVLAALTTPALLIYKAAAIYDFFQRQKLRRGK